MKSYLEAVRERVVIFDGATGTNLQRMELTADDFGGPQFEGCNEILVDTRPDVVADLHRSFFEVGSDVVETDTFYREVFFPSICLMQPGTSVALAQGTPIAQVIPVPREQWKMECLDLDLPRRLKVDEEFAANSHAYKEQSWQ